jgi:hypothetical protein
MVAAIVPDTPGTVLAVPATVLAVPATGRVIPGMVVRRAIVLPLPLFLQIRAIAQAIVLLPQPFLPMEATVRMAPVAVPVRGRALADRVLCRPLQEIVRARPRARDPAPTKPAAINVHRPLTLAQGKPIVPMHFPEPWGGVRRARAGTKVWQPRVATEERRVASGATFCKTRALALERSKLAG